MPTKPGDAEDPEWQRCRELAERCHIDAVHLTPEMLDPALLQQFSPDVLRNYRALPLTRDGFRLTVAMEDPLDVNAEDVLRSMSGCEIVRVAAPPSEILAALEGRLGHQESPIEAILERIPLTDEITYRQPAEDQDLQSEQELAATPPIIQLVSSILGDAIRMNASDIHVEPQKHTLRIRYRLDGSLRTMLELPKRVQNACLSRMKLISGLDISESRKPQDGRTRARIDGRDVDLRVSSLPTFRGEKIVMRILDPKAVMVSLENLGFREDDYARLQQVLASSQGMLLCTGPTGSGKTSTLYSALVELNTETDNIVTVEDPVEYQLEGVNQVQVNVRAELTFATALRSILRQDPDVVLVGEIRDAETAEIAIQAAQTGHLVLSTLHTNDAVSTLSRLVLMGIPSYLVGSALLCVIAQRLVRRLCRHCRRPEPASERVIRRLASAGIVLSPEGFWAPGGCEQCRFVGYKGRLGVFEILIVSEAIRAALLAGQTETEIQILARAEGMHSLVEDGLLKCRAGDTSLEEVLRVLTLRPASGVPVVSVPAAPVLQAGPASTTEQHIEVMLVSSDPALTAEVAASLSAPDLRLRTHGENGLDQPADVILLDYDTLPPDGEGLIRQVRSQHQGSPVLLLASAGPHGVQGLELQADEILLKPVDGVRLAAHVRQALEVAPGHS